MVGFALVILLFYLGLNAKKMKIYTYRVVIIALIVVIGILVKCNHEVKVQREAALDDVERVRIQLKSDSSYKVEMQQVLSSEKAARVVAENELQGYKLKNVKSVVQTRFEVKVKEVEVPYLVRDTIVKDSTVYIRTNTRFALSDSFKYITGVVDTNGIKIDSLGLYPSKLTVVIGDIKQGFLKKSKPSVVIDFNSPYIRPVSGSNLIVQDKRKPKRLAWLASGVVVGLVGGILLIAH